MTALAAIHTGLRQLGIDEDDARDLYERQTGKRSLRGMSPREHESVIGELRRLGFKPASKRARTQLAGRFAKKLQALWIAAWNLGVVQDRRDEALIEFVKRQAGVDHVRFLHDPADARKAIEGLKGWMARQAGVSWKPTNLVWLGTDPAKIAWAQYRLLIPGATVMGNGRMFLDACIGILGREIGTLQELSPADWRAVMNSLGERVRKASRA